MTDIEPRGAITKARKPLTERDLETLGDLVHMRYKSPARQLYEGGTAPIDFGGSNGSHHGKTATKLAAHGFVEQRFRGLDWGERGRSTGARGSKVYRATPAGRDAWEAYQQLKHGAKMVEGPRKRKFGKTIPTQKRVELTKEDRKLLRKKCHMEPAK